jgi:hypothetical protein
MDVGRHAMNGKVVVTLRKLKGRNIIYLTREEGKYHG